MAPHIRSHRLPCSCFPKDMSLQLSSEQSVGDVGITQLDWKRVPHARSRGCKCSVAVVSRYGRLTQLPVVSRYGRGSEATGGPCWRCKRSSPYSTAKRRVPELIPDLGSQPAGDVSHKPGDRLPLLSATPAVTLAALNRAATNFAAW